jgi:hypothetical protein
VRIAKSAPQQDWRLFAILATIEVERHRKTNPQLPVWLAEDYEAAWHELSSLALQELATSTDALVNSCALSVVALAKCDLKLGALLANWAPSEIDELAEEILGWSDSYE